MSFLKKLKSNTISSTFFTTMALLLWAPADPIWGIVLGLLVWGGFLLVWVGLRLRDQLPGGLYLSALTGMLLVGCWSALAFVWPKLSTDFETTALLAYLVLLALFGLSVWLFLRDAEEVRAELASDTEQYTYDLLYGLGRWEQVNTQWSIPSTKMFGCVWPLAIIPLRAVVITVLLLRWVPTAGVTPPGVLAAFIVVASAVCEYCVLRLLQIGTEKIGKVKAYLLLNPGGAASEHDSSEEAGDPELIQKPADLELV